MKARRRLIEEYMKGESRVRHEDRHKVVDQFLAVTVERGVSLKFARPHKPGEDLPYRMDFSIKPSTKRLSWLMDIDYTAPIWANVLALAVAAYYWPR